VDTDRKSQREALGLLQSEAAHRAGVSLATWRRWEEGALNVAPRTAARCESVLMKHPYGLKPSLNETHREYLDGPTAEELRNDFWPRLSNYGHHTSDGALGRRTPRAIIVAALSVAGGPPTVRYREPGRRGVQNVTGLVWEIQANNVHILSPDNRPGAVDYFIPVDWIVSVEVPADDSIVREPLPK